MMTGLPCATHDSWHPLLHFDVYAAQGKLNPYQRNPMIFPLTSGNRVDGTPLHSYPQHSQTPSETHCDSFFSAYPVSPIPDPWQVCVGTLTLDLAYHNALA